MLPIPIPRVDTEKKPEHVGEGLLQGVNKWCDHVGEGATKLWRKPQEGHQREGALGAAKGVGAGLLDLATGVGKGACDLFGSTLEGVRHTPDAVADRVSKDRKHNKHGVEGEGRGDILETYVEEEEEPEHLGEGLVHGVRGLGRGLVSGVKDLYHKPMDGAKEGGAMGFAKGAGQGLLGFGTKAASGAIDLATSVLSGAKNTPDAIGKKVNDLTGRPSAGAAAGAPRPATWGGTGSSSGSSASSNPRARFVSTASSDAEARFVAFSGTGQALGSDPAETSATAPTNAKPGPSS